MSDVYWTHHTHVHYIHKVTLYTANIACLLAVLALANTANIRVIFSTKPDKEDQRIKRFCLRYVYLNPVVQTKQARFSYYL